MLFKGEELAIRTSEDGAVFSRHYKQMLNIRLFYEPQGAPGVADGLVFMPYCHHVSHAYARAFGVEVVDGERVHVTKVKTYWFGHFVRARVARYAHSWNVVTLPSGKRVIFDLFPNETCSMLPVVTLEPNPAYTKHWDGLAEKGVRELLARPFAAEQMDLLVEQFKALAVTDTDTDTD